MAELDLETGASTDTPKRGGRPKGSTGTPAGPARKETELRIRLETTFSKIADSFAARGDDELAVAISEEKKPMAAGLLNLTANVKPLRNPLVALLALIEPGLAFGRVGRILGRRVAARRAQNLEEQHAREQAFADADANLGPDTYVG
jgi:hypothetical protein